MPTILIIDDDAITAKLYREFLERSQFNVEVYADGAVALERLEADGADALVVDLMMPKMNGFEFMKHVRAMDRYKTTPMLAYTTAYIPQLVNQAKEAGATEVYDKTKLNGQLLKTALQQFLVI